MKNILKKVKYDHKRKTIYMSVMKEEIDDICM